LSAGALVYQPPPSILVPLIIVFTKYDKLVTREERAFDESQFEGLSEEEILERIKEKASAAFMDECITTFTEHLGPQIPPYKEVSSKAPCSCLTRSYPNFVMVSSSRVPGQGR